MIFTDFSSCFFIFLEMSFFLFSTFYIIFHMILHFPFFSIFLNVVLHFSSFFFGFPHCSSFFFMFLKFYSCFHVFFSSSFFHCFVLPSFSFLLFFLLFSFFFFFSCFLCFLFFSFFFLLFFVFPMFSFLLFSICHSFSSFFPVVRADAKTRKKSSTKRTIFLCEKKTFVGLGGQWRVRSGRFEGDFAFFFFLFLFFFFFQNLFFWDPQLLHDFSQHFFLKNSKILSRLGRYPLRPLFLFSHFFMLFISFFIFSIFLFSVLLEKCDSLFLFVF